MTEKAVAFLVSKGVVVSDEIKHYGVKGMKWGETKTVAELQAEVAGKKPVDEQAILKAGLKALSASEKKNLSKAMRDGAIVSLRNGKVIYTPKKNVKAAINQALRDGYTVGKTGSDEKPVYYVYAEKRKK